MDTLFNKIPPVLISAEGTGVNTNGKEANRPLKHLIVSTVCDKLHRQTLYSPAIDVNVYALFMYHSWDRVTHVKIVSVTLREAKDIRKYLR